MKYIALQESAADLARAKRNESRAAYNNAAMRIWQKWRAPEFLATQGGGGGLVIVTPTIPNNTGKKRLQAHRRFFLDFLIKNAPDNCTAIVSAVRDGGGQKGLSPAARANRKLNFRLGAFYETPASGGNRVGPAEYIVDDGQPVIIVDDFAVTGATLNDVARAVRAAGGRVTGALVLAGKGGVKLPKAAARRRRRSEKPARLPAASARRKYTPATSGFFARLARWLRGGAD